MIVVTGATGQLGRAIVERLIAGRVPASEVGASVRDPAKAGDLAAQGVRVRQGDFADRQGLAHAFEGAAQILIVSSNAAASGGDPLAQHRNAIDAARAACVRRIVYTSHMAASAASAFPPMHTHAATEAMLRGSGLAWTALRNGFYASSGVSLMQDGLKTGIIEAPEDGKVAWTTHADLAEAAAIILANEGRFDGPTPPLTASQALDLADMAAIASKLLGRLVRRAVITEETLRETMTARSVPLPAVEIALGLYRASRASEFAAIDPTLEELLGRPPTKLDTVIGEVLQGRS
ncbi:NAD(P)H-binding protein [Lichenicoccus sp.]|uniref:NmrA family NAD(P)-binding protein n=1 Tax=Lichenicoccus sp. TaxID=2781899 RepID=UPI003D0D19C9